MTPSSCQSPVVAIGFAMGTNTFEQGPNPDGTQSADGFYHPEDEVHLPWFMRLAPNTVSEPTQTSSANIGRYTFMGDLNPFPGFREPATGCQQLVAELCLTEGPGNLGPFFLHTNFPLRRVHTLLLVNRRCARRDSEELGVLDVLPATRQLPLRYC